MDKEVWVHLKDRKDITKAGNLAEAIKSLMATISRG
jgi:hypothetical protein